MLFLVLIAAALSFGVGVVVVPPVRPVLPTAAPTSAAPTSTAAPTNFGDTHAPTLRPVPGPTRAPSTRHPTRTPVGQRTVMFGLPLTDGLPGARDAADAYCAGSPTAGALGCADGSVHAFIGYEGEGLGLDNYANLFGYSGPVFGPNGLFVGDSIDAMLTRIVNVSLFENTAGDHFAILFSLVLDNMAGGNCDDWTNSGGGAGYLYLDLAQDVTFRSIGSGPCSVGSSFIGMMCTCFAETLGNDFMVYQTQAQGPLAGADAGCGGGFNSPPAYDLSVQLCSSTFQVARDPSGLFDLAQPVLLVNGQQLAATPADLLTADFSAFVTTPAWIDTTHDIFTYAKTQGSTVDAATLQIRGCLDTHAYLCLCTGNMTLYSSGAVSDGYSVGDRALAGAGCLGCPGAVAVLEYTYGALADFPALYSFDPGAPLALLDGTPVANDWPSFVALDLLGGLGGEYWVGNTTTILSDTPLLSNCGDWSERPLCAAAYPNGSLGDRYCDDNLGYVCGCFGDAPAPQPHIIIFSAQLNGGDTCGMERGGFYCATFAPLTGLPGLDPRYLNVSHGFDVTLPIVGPGGTVIADNWGQFIDGDLTTSLLDAGVLEGQHAWIGGADDCNGFSSMDNDHIGGLASLEKTAHGWLDDGPARCDQTYYALCACMGSVATAAPATTAAPVPAPSVVPTAAPTTITPDVLFFAVPTDGSWLLPVPGRRLASGGGFTPNPTVPPIPPPLRGPANQFCADNGRGRCVSDAFAFIRLPDEAQMPMPFEPTAPVHEMNTGDLVASSITDFFGGTSLVLLNSYAGTNFAWIEFDDELNCLNWTSNDSGELGRVSALDNFQFTSSDISLSCQQATVVLCLCNGYVLSDPAIIYDVVNLGIAVSSLGPREQTTELCEADAQFTDLGCDRAIALLCYSGGDDVAAMPRTYGFDPGQVVIAINGSAYEDWPAFILGQGTGPTESYVTGCALNGSTGLNCDDFTDSGGYFDYGYYPTYDPNDNMYVGQSVCYGVRNVHCICLGAHTPAPSAAPVPAPTTAPTASPTFATPTILFSDSGFLHATLGDRATSTATCDAVLAGFPSLDCARTVALICYSGGDTLELFPTHYGVSAGGQVQAPDGTVIAPDWTTFVSGTLTNPIWPSCVSQIYLYSGCPSSHNCQDWTSTSSGDTSYLMDASSVNVGWQSLGPFGCNSLSPLLCVCIAPQPTAVPTASPTASPTAAAIVIYDLVNTDIASDNLGTRGQTTDMCEADAQFASLGCARAVALLCYSNMDDAASMPQTYGFDPDQPVVGIGGDTYGNWSVFIIGNGTGPTESYVTGCAPDGSTGANCDDFTTLDVVGYAYYPSAEPQNNMYHAETGCDVPLNLHCVCLGVPITAGPTQQPTPDPTAE
jgi:hypothetical protein